MSDEASLEFERETLEWVHARMGRIAGSDPVSRWVVAMPAASLALELNDLDEADRWLLIAQSALDSPTLASVREDPHWILRYRGLVAGAGTLRWLRQAETQDGVPSAGQARRLDDWLEAGRIAWSVEGVTPTSLLLERMRGLLPPIQ
jgi:hypothetical protein